MLFIVVGIVKLNAMLWVHNGNGDFKENVHVTELVDH